MTRDDFRKGLRPERPRRPRELQDPLNHYLYHPLAWQLALRLARTPLTPNMVSVIGGLFKLNVRPSEGQQISLSR